MAQNGQKTIRRIIYFTPFGGTLQSELEALLRRHTTPQQIALRAQIVLLAQQGKNNQDIARKLDISVHTARHWRERWRELQE